MVRRSLWFRLMGVFLAVIGAGLAVVVLVANAVSARQFEQFVSGRGQSWVEQIAPQLEAYYAETGSWTDAQTLLDTPFGGGQGQGQRRGQGQGQGQGMMGGGGQGMHGEMMSGGNMWGAMGIHLVLADAQGRVVADTDGQLVGRHLSEDILDQGRPLVVDGQQVGTLIATDPDVASSVAGDFLQAINRSVLLAALVAGVVALTLGTVLFRRITRPLSDMNRAARRVAAGDLEARVPATRQDELGQLARSFNHMADGLSQQQTLRKQMVADIAHELRTPISVMQGTLEAMLDGILPPDAEELRGLHDETLHLTRLVADLRTLSLADAGQLALERQQLDVGALVQEVVRRMKPLAEEKGIALGHTLADTPPLQADAQRLTQVVTNLIDNALRYTPRGGDVQVSVEQANGQVRIGVSDDGPGIPAEALPHVFDRFWRGEKSRNRAGGGSGLGLAIVRQLVEAHGGSVGVESEVGSGATFSVLLPLEAAPPKKLS